jgi:hypothetical protein
MTPDELAEHRMLETLRQRISDPRGLIFGGPPLSHAEYLAYVSQYDALKARIDQREAERERLRLEEERTAVERTKVLTAREVEHRKLDIEEDRVRVEKAQVLLKAIEIAAERGADPNHLLAAVTGLGQHLLPEAKLNLPALPGSKDV